MEPEHAQTTFDQFVEDTTSLNTRTARFAVLNRRHALLAERFQQAADLAVGIVPASGWLSQLRRVDALLTRIERQRQAAVEALEANVAGLVTGT